MRLLGSLPIRHKLSAVTLCTSLIVVFFASLVLILTEVSSYRRMMLQELGALASIIGGNASAALVFEDQRAAEEILTTLAAKPSITAARIYRPDGTLFARYDRGEAPNAHAPIFRSVAEPTYELAIWPGYAEILAPIKLETDTVGEIVIAADLSQLNAVLGTLIGAALMAIMLSALGAWMLSAQMQSFISRPILDLLAVMQQVSQGNDYSLRMHKSSTDELGQLADGLNAMLERIEANDASLRSAWKEATAASRSKSEFLANMSHELRTPLNAILGFSELMRREIRGPLGHASYVEYVTDIHESGKHLLEVIGDILDLSKIEAGELKLDPVEIELPQLVRKTVRLIAQRARAGGLILDVAVDEGLPLVEADERLIKQALLNLLSNAVKFTPKGGRVMLTVAAKGSDAVTMTVQDTGIGMAAHELPRVFTPFVQVESSTSRKFEGTGLGLPLTKSFVEAHGGTLTLDSAPGQGTTAVITLPLTLAPAIRTKRAGPALRVIGRAS